MALRLNDKFKVALMPDDLPSLSVRVQSTEQISKLALFVHRHRAAHNQGVQLKDTEVDVLKGGVRLAAST